MSGNEISESCLDCIYEAEKVNTPLPANATGCHFYNNRDYGYSCGPYSISEAYWDGCSEQQIGNRFNTTWQECAFDMVCARTCVKFYTQRHVSNCKYPDGQRLCIDFGSIHAGHEQGCNRRDTELNGKGDIYYYTQRMIEQCGVKDHVIPPSSDPPEDNTGAIIAGVLVPILVILSILGALFYWRKRRSASKGLRMDRISSGGRSLAQLADFEQKYTDIYNRHRIPIECLDLFEELGRGHFGQIRRAKLLDGPGSTVGTTVAVKLLKNSAQLTTEEIEAFLGEAAIMEEFDHANVLSLVGLVWEKGELPCVVLPYMGNGDLLHLVKKSEMKFNEADLLNFTAQISDGLAYLESRNFVHRDIALRNCLVSSYFVVKISDFGLSRDTYEKNYYVTTVTDKQLPWKWLAIESMQHGRFSNKSDVWSFGILMWELFTKGSSPYPAITSLQMLQDCLESGYRLSRPPDCPETIHTMMTECWKFSPEDRPTFAQLKLTMADIMKERDNEISYDYTPEARQETHRQLETPQTSLDMPDEQAPGIPGQIDEMYVIPISEMEPKRSPRPTRLLSKIDPSYITPRGEVSILSSPPGSNEPAYADSGYVQGVTAVRMDSRISIQTDPERVSLQSRTEPSPQ